MTNKFDKVPSKYSFPSIPKISITFFKTLVFLLISTAILYGFNVISTYTIKEVLTKIL